VCSALPWREREWPASSHGPSHLHWASPLSERERQVLRLAADGRSAAAIASEVFLSVGTVRNHLSSAIGKTGAANRAQAVRIAQDNGWI
jgi:two-component system response regulator DesR